MRKYTLRELRELVRLGMAVNITEADPKSIKEPVEKIGYSSGVDCSRAGKAAIFTQLLLEVPICFISFDGGC